MKPKTIYRSSITGKIVTAKYAKENPAITEKETIRAVPKNALMILKKFQECRTGNKDENITKAIDEILEYFEK